MMVHEPGIASIASTPRRAVVRPGSSRTADLLAGRAAIALVAALGLAVLVAAAPAGDRGAVVVVVNAAGPLTDVTKAQLRDVFLGRLRVVGGVRVRPVQLEGPARAELLRALLGMSESEFQLYWLRRTYEEGVLPPSIRGDDEQVLEYVSREKGAVGFVAKASVVRTDRVKVVYEVAMGH